MRISRLQSSTSGRGNPCIQNPDNWGNDRDFLKERPVHSWNQNTARILSLNASSPDAGAIAHWGVQSDANGDAADSNQYFEREPLDAVGGPVLDATEDEKAIVEIVYRLPGGSYTTADFIADESGIFGGANCAVAGTSEVAGA